MNTEEGIDIGIKFLEQYRETIKDINRIFEPILIAAYIIWSENVQIIDDVEKYQKNLDNLYSLYNESLTRAGGSLSIEFSNNLDEYFEYIVKSHSAGNDLSAMNSQKDKRQLWQNTEIIRALIDIGANIANKDGWISFSVCEQRLKTEYPEIKPDNYGFSNILEIIKTSNLFKIKKVKLKKHNKYKIYFRLNKKN
ncbi:OST-HTH/LOTUS domain-containing protein [Dendronalium phyllosphericum]|uniref:OST-HTH/LOTUS domain-containing protein n=1 Tax=Dendronalium phyllosphericum TaxID=2840445 RepID=UPI0030D83BB0